MRLDITEREKAILLQAVEMINDMHTDMCLEDVPLNLWPKGGDEEKSIVTPDNSKAIREGIYKVIETTVTIRSLLARLGGKVNDNGYSL